MPSPKPSPSSFLLRTLPRGFHTRRQQPSAAVCFTFSWFVVGSWRTVPSIFTSSALLTRRGVGQWVFAFFGGAQKTLMGARDQRSSHPVAARVRDCVPIRPQPWTSFYSKQNFAHVFLSVCLIASLARSVPCFVFFFDNGVLRSCLCFHTVNSGKDVVAVLHQTTLS